eukprot:COSAG06_NODE_29158_length_561_cov_2.170996_2_plen_63_part_01
MTVITCQSEPPGGIRRIVPLSMATPWVLPYVVRMLFMCLISLCCSSDQEGDSPSYGRPATLPE